MKLQNLFPVLVTCAFLAQGCAGPSLEGNWTALPGEKLPIDATFKTTFSKPDKLAVVINATSPVPGVGDLKLEADVDGTWKLDGETLTMQAVDTKLKSSDGKELPGFMAESVKGMVGDVVQKGMSGKVKWDGNDKFVVTLDSGKTATFERIKG